MTSHPPEPPAPWPPPSPEERPGRGQRPGAPEEWPAAPRQRYPADQPGNGHRAAAATRPTGRPRRWRITRRRPATGLRPAIQPGAVPGRAATRTTRTCPTTPRTPTPRGTPTSRATRRRPTIRPCRTTRPRPATSRPVIHPADTRPAPTRPMATRPRPTRRRTGRRAATRQADPRWWSSRRPTAAGRMAAAPVTHEEYLHPGGGAAAGPDTLRARPGPARPATPDAAAGPTGRRLGHARLPHGAGLRLPAAAGHLPDVPAPVTLAPGARGPGGQRLAHRDSCTNCPPRSSARCWCSIPPGSR